MRKHPSLLIVLISLSLGVLPALGAPAVLTDKVTSGQKSAAMQFLAAVASGDPQAVAFAIHPDDLQALRTRILGLLHDEAKRGDSTVRARLFGQGMPLQEIEHLTSTGFYATLAYKLTLTGREYADADALAAVPDKDGRVNIVLRARPPRDRGKVAVINVVTIRPFGTDWKATIPYEIDAQIDDLIAGRNSVSVVTGGAARPSAMAAAQPGIVELLNAAEKSLTDGKCDEYYNKQMSPNFRRVTGKKALEALVSSCQQGMGTRELLLSTLRIVRGLQPRYEYEGQRAVYDVSGQGLPFDQFVLEQMDKHWYIAE